MATISDVGLDDLVDPDEDGSAQQGTNSSTGARAARGGGWFRAFWRWHFYASLLVIPIMLMLAVTGLIYLFRWQIDPAMHPGVLTFERPTYGSVKAYAAQEAAVKAAFPQASVKSVQESAENRATIFTVGLGDKTTRNVYVNPYTGRVLGSLADLDLLSNQAVKVHGQIIFGSVADTKLFDDPIVGTKFTIGTLGGRIIETAACWAIVMTLTGYYLFVRGRGARLRRVARGARAASMRHRHGLVGAVLGGGILLLVVSGLPWTGLWGARVQNWAAGHSLGLWGEDPGAKSTLAAKLNAIGSTSAPAPWAEGQQHVPTSGQPAQPTATSAASDGGAGHAGHVMGGAGTSTGDRISIDQAVAVARGDGLPGPYYVAYPDGDDGVFSILSDQWHDAANPAFNDVSQERTVHVDQYSGTIAGRYGYTDYSPAAKVVSQGIALHEGRRFGSFNTVGTTAFCLGVIFLCVTGPLMWWKRRPRGAGMAAPRGRMPLKAAPGLLVLLVVLGLFLPMFGISVLLVLLFDQLVVRRVPALRSRFGTT
jgi:uncharacterized iron-regulated membrane protein